MSASFQNVTAATVTLGNDATAAGHAVRLSQLNALLAAMFKGAWASGTAYTAGVYATDSGGLYVSLQASTGKQPSLYPAYWSLLCATGAAGASAHVYVGYASDTSGTGFSLTPGTGLDHVAFKVSATVISSPQASDFAGLWTPYVGAAGADGSDGSDGSDGASAHVYVGYASDNAGTGFSTTPADALQYIAVKVSATEIVSPSASDFTGLWKLYGRSPYAATAPVVISGSTISVNSASASTASYLVQRDASGNFAGNVITGTTFSIGGSATLTYSSSAVQCSSAFTAAQLNLSTSGFYWGVSAGKAVLTGGGGVVCSADGTTLTVTALKLAGVTAGMLKSDSGGAVVGGADTDDLAEGATNLWHTEARVRATPLTGLVTTSGGAVAATDTLLVALGRIQNRLAELEASAVLGDPALIYEDTVELAAGSGTGVVTGLALKFTPTRVQLSVQLPRSDALAIMAVPVGDPTTDGFEYGLTGLPDTGGYKMHFRITG